MSMSLNDALDLLAESPAGLLSGGTDYYPALNDATPRQHLLNVQDILGLDVISEESDHWRIGAAVTWSQLIHADLPPCFACLKQAGMEVGSVQIQNAASVVGNICNASPAADGMPALLVLEAIVEIQSAGSSRTVPLHDFVTGVRTTVLQQGEMVTALHIPKKYNTDRTAFIKLGSRTYLVISIVMCASRISLDDAGVITGAAIAVGACSPVACRLHDLESSLIGKTCDFSTLEHCVDEEHLSALTPISDVRATATYRMQATKILLQRQLSAFAKDSMSASA